MTWKDQIRYAFRRTGNTARSCAPKAGIAERTAAAAARGDNVQGDSLEAVARGLGWSWRLLSPEEAQLIDRLRLDHEPQKRQRRSRSTKPKGK